jgi:hypothetical protein
MVTKKEIREQRLAAALKANLKRRKDAAKASVGKRTDETVQNHDLNVPTEDN